MNYSSSKIKIPLTYDRVTPCWRHEIRRPAPCPFGPRGRLCPISSGNEQRPSSRRSLHAFAVSVREHDHRIPMPRYSDAERLLRRRREVPLFERTHLGGIQSLRLRASIAPPWGFPSYHAHSKLGFSAKHFALTSGAQVSEELILHHRIVPQMLDRPDDLLDVVGRSTQGHLASGFREA